MTKPPANWPNFPLVAGILFLGGSLLLWVGCQDRGSPTTTVSGARQRRNNDSAFLVDTLAKGLNNLPSEIVLDLQPPEPILDDSKSIDGQPVMAACSATPAVPDGPINYLYVPKRNANFRKLGIRRGDIVHYFVDVDEDSMEHGIAQMNSFKLNVRRVDVNNPHALIFEGGISQPVPEQFAKRIEIWRISDQRMTEIGQRITGYWKKPKRRIGWEPSPDESALEQLLERANQWLRNRHDDEPWQPDPLVSELAPKLREAQPLAELITDSALQAGPFVQSEARQLQQAIWLRDISRWANGEAVSPVEVATALFDWTVRNIQLDDVVVGADNANYIHQPWQALIYGHGSAEHRAWVFAELCRQQQLDVVMLAVGDKWWLPALLHEEKLYLYDIQLGLPIPGKGPDGIATLAEVVADTALLRTLDVDKENRYAVSAEDLQQITAWLVASPLQLSKRALLLEEALEGDDYVVLSADTRRPAEELAKHANLSKVKLWPLPFESLLAENEMPADGRLRVAQRFLILAQRPRLWKARVLHFQGTKDIPIEERNDPLAQPDLGHQQATSLYQHRSIRPPNTVLQTIEPAKRAIYMAAKGDASYWLGLLSYDLEKYQVARNWLAVLTLEATPDGPWTASARYNLARTHEALGDLPAAIELLNSDDSPQRYGNLLRARQLEGKLRSASEKNNE